ncbi:MAG: bifunctional serine/threonine-protein kinase/formylglycine-generating enzyme family protein [Victivallaceae bacterium]|nr:bifunctional serine/threonine-protein kinase/formylglycine-generating enzyme family protein [Victivallaceae bacterium]
MPHRKSCDESNMRTAGETVGDARRQISMEELRGILNTDPARNFGDMDERATVGVGGVGAVFTARDPELNRMVAIKVLRPPHRTDSKYIDALVREARTTAQIDHPNVVPVYSLGVFDDAGAFFSMKLVEGENLRTVLEKLAAGAPGYRRKYTLNTLLDVFMAVCNAISFAHSKGIIHRDLKPANVMLGNFGEVMVMDWGMAKYHAEKDSAPLGRKLDIPSEISDAVDEDVKDQFDTHAGSLHGTPAFMAPEQALGRAGELDERTDIYCLGAMLYSILTWEKSPFDASLPVADILQRCADGDFVPPRKQAPDHDIPVELEAITLKAMARRRDDRYGSVHELIADIRRYRDLEPVAAYSSKLFYRMLKAYQRKPMIPFGILTGFIAILAAAIVLLAVNFWRGTPLRAVTEEHISAGDRALDHAMDLLARRRELLATPGQPQYDVVRKFQQDIRDAREEAESNYGVALDLLSRLEGTSGTAAWINAQRADIYGHLLEFQLASGNFQKVIETMTRLEERNIPALNYLSATSPELFAHAKAVMSGMCFLSISADGNDITLYTMPVDGKPMAEAGTGKSLLLQLPSGGYVAEVKADDGRSAAFPFTADPGSRLDLTFALPPSIPTGTVYVPPGKFNTGFAVDDNLYDTVDLLGFFIGQKEVSFGEYREFYDSLDSAEERKICAPLFLFSPVERNYEPIFGPDGTIRAPFTASMPVVGINASAAKRYCRWYGRKHNLKCRLPTLLEWEKAARGVDGRSYVWGNNYTPDFALCADNSAASFYPNGAPSGTFPQDRSVYGALDMAGNVREYCLSAPGSSPAAEQVKGGGFNSGGRYSIMCHSMPGNCFGNEPDVGFRILIEP